MATVPQSPSAPAPPVRHGKCRLILAIGEDLYTVRKRKAHSRHAKMWSLTHATGPRRGVIHFIGSYQNVIACSCEDHSCRGSWCKHMRALQAAGLINPRLRPWVRGTAPLPTEGGE